MKSQKQKLTRLINQVRDKFPDGDDIFGYSGVTKDKIISSMESSYKLLALLEETTEEVETVWAKRTLAKQFDEINGLLKEFGTEKWVEEFDIFLELITKIRVTLKDLYITLTDNPIRVELEIQDALEQYNSLTETCEKLDEKIQIIKKGSERVEILIDTLEKTKVNNITTSENSEKILNNIRAIEKEILEKNKDIEEIAPEVKKLSEECKELHKSLSLNKDNIEVLINRLENSLNNIETVQSNLDKQVENNTIIQGQIAQTLQDVNRHGMAGAFLKRKNELKSTVIIWGLLSVVSIGILIYISYKLAVQVINASNFDLIRNLFRIPSFIASVWLCWFCAKQFGYNIRIMEDYSFKYAISMAFEGYKNETREINEDLLEKLLELTVVNISSNPVTLFNSKSNHGSPWHELSEGISKFVKADVKANVTADTKDLIL